MSTRAVAPRSSSSSPSTDAAVLVVEDDRAIAEVLATALGRRGYGVSVARSARDAHERITIDEPDVVLLDLGLPDRDGLELCRDLRTWFRNPIIVITADGDEDRKVAALDLGADDYITKPFSMAELLARVRVGLRHRALLASVVDPLELVVGDLIVDTGAHVAVAGAEPLTLTRKEFGLLTLLARNPGRLVTHRRILDNVWGAEVGTTESLRVHVTNLRRKLGDGPARPRIVTESGVGYRLVAPSDDQPGATVGP